MAGEDCDEGRDRGDGGSAVCDGARLRTPSGWHQRDGLTPNLVDAYVSRTETGNQSPRKAVARGPSGPRPAAIFFETMSKRRKGFPSEAKVKRGVRIVNGNKELAEKLGRNDLCPCGSGKRFKRCCLDSGCF